VVAVHAASMVGAAARSVPSAPVTWLGLGLGVG
jgi:hypothetical protein